MALTILGYLYLLNEFETTLIATTPTCDKNTGEPHIIKIGCITYNLSENEKITTKEGETVTIYYNGNPLRNLTFKIPKMMSRIETGALPENACFENVSFWDFLKGD